MKRSTNKKVHIQLDLFYDVSLIFERWFLKALGATQQISYGPQKPSCGLHIVQACRGSPRSGSWPIVITRFSTIVSSCTDRFGQFSVRLHGWQVNLLLCRSLSAQSSSTFQGKLVAWWNEALLQSFHVVYVSKQCVYCIGNKLSCCLCLGAYLLYLLVVFHKLLEPNRNFVLKMDFDVHDLFATVSSVPNQEKFYRHYSSTALECAIRWVQANHEGLKLNGT
jgi:hypothetical protein